MNSLAKTRLAAAAQPWRQAWREWGATEGLTWIFVGKTLLTAFVALWLAYRLELPQPSTVLATVFIIIQPQSGQVLAKSFYRLLGSVLGLAVMVLLIALFAQEPVLFLLTLALWIGLCTAGAARYRDFRGYACVLAGYTAAMIGLPASLHPDGAFMQALWRLLEISLGIICTGVINALVLPQTSSSSLRTSLAARFRDFAGFACGGLAGRFDQRNFERLSARFAAEAVGLENLRSASTFENPHMRLRSGRLARLNNEFMLLSTRFHALHQLLQRLHSTAGEPLLQALQPSLGLVSALLAPLRLRLGTERDALQLAEQLQRCQQALMAQIRQSRQQLQSLQPSAAQLLDFNTAAELLYRFVADLHGYALTHASLIDRHHEREQWQPAFTPRANALAAAVAGLRSGLLIVLLSSFWIATAWPSGGTFAMTAAMVAALASGTANPKRLALQLLVGALGGSLLGFVLLFRVLPQLDGFALLCCALAPVFAFGAWLLSRSQWQGYGMGLLMWFCVLALPANLTQYNPARFFNEYLATFLSMGMVALLAASILPPNRPWLWRRLQHDLRLRVVHAVNGKLKGLVVGFESGSRDLLNQALGFSVGHPEVQRQLLRWMFAVQEIGHAFIELRQEQQNLPVAACYAPSMPWRRAIDALGQTLVRLFKQPQEEHRQAALQAVEAAIECLRHTPEPCAPQFDSSPLRRVLSYLHFIRSSLLDPHSPLAPPVRLLPVGVPADAP